MQSLQLLTRWMFLLASRTMSCAVPGTLAVLYSFSFLPVQVHVVDAVRMAPKQVAAADDDNDDGNNPANGNARTVTVTNESPVRFSILWLNPHDDDDGDDEQARIVSPPGGVAPGATYRLSDDISVAVGDRFDIYELVNPRTGLCRDSSSGDGDDLDETCWSETFTISKGQEIEVTVGEDFGATVMDSQRYAQQQAVMALEHCRRDYDETDGNVGPQDDNLLLACLHQGTSAALKHWTREWTFHSRALQHVGAPLENYICHDANANTNTSPAISQFTWEAPHDYITHNVQVLLDRFAAQIHVIPDFIEPEECQAVNHYEQQQQAWHQATIHVPWHLEQDDHPLTTLSRRVYDYTNHVLKTNITEHGQEPLFSSLDVGPNDTNNRNNNNNYDRDYDEEQASHCDGPCDGRRHVAPERVATMIMYCQTPPIEGGGGHHHFRNAGVHIRPHVGMALFFSYINPVEMEMDTGLTEHSSCPVLQGKKQIVTQYVRWGVDQENPWNNSLE